MADVTIISGTDPTNPRCARDIVLRLRQIERDTAAMRDEAKRLSFFAGRIRDVLLWQGKSFGTAVAETQEVVGQINGVIRDLEAASLRTGIAAGWIESSRVNQAARFSDIHDLQARGRR